MSYSKKKTRYIQAALVASMVLFGALGSAQAGEERIFNGQFNTSVQFGLEGDSAVKKSAYEFSVVETGDLHFKVGCQNQSQMKVAIKGYGDKDRKTSPAPLFSEENHETTVFTFAVTKEHLAHVKTWEVEVSSDWAMPVCNLDLHHNERVSMFRSTDNGGSSPMSLRTGKQRWASTPFVIFVSKKAEDGFNCAEP